jgi:hypothetical protein
MVVSDCLHASASLILRKELRYPLISLALLDIELQSPNPHPSKFHLVLFSLIVFYDFPAFERK